MIQIDVDMPGCCASCPMLKEIRSVLSRESYYYCGAAGFRTSDISKRPMKLCPIVGIRPDPQLKLYENKTPMDIAAVGDRLAIIESQEGDNDEKC